MNLRIEMTLDSEIVARKLGGKTKNNLLILTANSWLEIFILSFFYLSISIFHVTKTKIYTAFACRV